MAAGEQISSLFASLGFKVDERGAKQFERKLTNLERKLKSVGKTQQKAFGNNGASRATQRVDKQRKAVTSLTSRYDRFGGALMRVKDDMRKTNELFRSGNIGAERRNDLLSRMTREYDRLARAKAKAETYGEKGRGRPGKMGPKFRGSMAGFVPGFGAAFAGVQSVQSYQQAIGMEQGLTSATGSVEQAGKDMEYLEEVSQRLGLYLGNVGTSFTQMSAAARGSTMAGQGVRDIFEGISAQARVMNLSAADTQGIFRAVTQIMNKKQVMAEELKNQLGERMPGAIQATARALNMFTETGEADTEALFKAMENGELTAKEVLPKLAAEMQRTAETGGALENAMNNTSAAINRFRTQLFLSNRTFNESGFDEAVGSLFDRMSTALAEAEPLWILLGKSASFFGSALEAPIELAGTLASKLGHFTEEGYKFSDAAKQMGLMIVAILKPLRKAAFWFFILPAAIAAVNDLIENGFNTDSWQDLALQLGVIGVAVGGLLFKFRKLFRLFNKAPKLKTSGWWNRGGSAASSGSSATRSPSIESLRRDSAKSSWNRATRSFWKMPEWLKSAGEKISSNRVVSQAGGLKGIGGKALGPLSMIPMLPDAYESIMDSNVVRSFTGRATDLDLAAFRDYGVGTALNPDTMQSVNSVAQAAPQFNGDINFNIESNDPEEVGLYVNEKLNDLLRGASLQNPEVEQ